MSTKTDTQNTPTDLKKYEMKEISINNIASPARYDRNNSREPIDGIFATQGIKIHQAGYFTFGRREDSDHIVLWTDIDNETLFNTTKEEKVKNLNRLSSKILNLIEKYNKQSLKEL